MKAVDIKFKKMEVSKIDFKQNEVEVRLIINDGKDKALMRKMKLDDVSVGAQEMMNYLRSRIKEVHQNQDIAEDILGGFVIIRFKDDEENSVERIAKFLGHVKERIRAANAGRMSYFEAEQKCRLDSLEF